MTINRFRIPLQLVLVLACLLAAKRSGAAVNDLCEVSSLGMGATELPGDEGWLGYWSKDENRYQPQVRISGFEGLIAPRSNPDTGMLMTLALTDDPVFTIDVIVPVVDRPYRKDLYVPLGGSLVKVPNYFKPYPSELKVRTETGFEQTVQLKYLRGYTNGAGTGFPEIVYYAHLQGELSMASYVKALVASQLTQRGPLLANAAPCRLVNRNGKDYTECSAESPQFYMSMRWYGSREWMAETNKRHSDAFIARIQQGACTPDRLTRTWRYNWDPNIWMHPDDDNAFSVAYEGADIDGDGLTFWDELGASAVEGPPPPGVECPAPTAENATTADCVTVDFGNDPNQPVHGIWTLFRAIRTDPFKADTDGDGLSDGAERCVGTAKAVCRMTSPLMVDSDGDGIRDNLDECHQYQGANEYPSASTPLPPGTEQVCDLDGDGLRDWEEEVRFHAAGESCTSCTDADIDNDGMPDGYETEQGFDPENPSVAVTLLYHPSQIEAPRAGTVAANVEAFFAAAQPGFTVHVRPRAASGISAERYVSDCGSFGGDGSASPVWLLDENVSAAVPASFRPLPRPTLPLGAGATDYVVSAAEALYTRVARLCLDASTQALDGDGVISSAFFGGTRGQGSSEVVARFPSPQTARQAAAWDRAVTSLLAHQLGHALNLHHGGRTEGDCNPFYPSVMNHSYDFQPSDCLAQGSVRFSNGSLAQRIWVTPGISETGWPAIGADLLEPLVGCWANGDDLRLDNLAVCTGQTTGMCGTCGAQQTCVNIFDYENPYWDADLTAYDVASLRTGSALSQARISGCDADVLYPGEDLSPASERWALSQELRDHNDLDWMESSIGVTVPFGRYEWDRCKASTSASCPATLRLLCCRAGSCDDKTEKDVNCPLSTIGTIVKEPSRKGNFPAWIARDVYGVSP